MCEVNKPSQLVIVVHVLNANRETTVTSAGRNLYGKYRSYKGAENDLRELSLRLKTHWYKVEGQISLIKDLDHALEENLRLHLSDLLEILNRKLENAKMKIQSVEDKQTRLKRAKFAILVKKTLEEAIAELDKWENQLDFPWYLMARISNPVVDQELTTQRTRNSDAALGMKRLRETIKQTAQMPEKSIFIPATDLEEGEIFSFPYSPMFLARLVSPGRTFLIDTVTSPASSMVDPDVVMRGIRDIGTILAQVDPMTFGILTCYGVIKSTDDGVSDFKFVFEIPDRLRNPCSLRSLLAISTNKQRPTYPLNERFELAKRLARSVMFVHSSNLVHKNIRPDTVVIFHDEANSLGIPFLVGFEKIRSVGAFTHLVGDAEWQKNLYRHPNRQGLRHEESYKMQHDIYSLGVCLLEIGLWTSFSCWNEETSCFEPGPDLDISEHLKNKDQRRRAHQIKETLVDMAVEQLPGAMGQRYTEVTTSCLMCLDKGDNGFGDEKEFTDVDGISIGVRYVEKVRSLRRIFV